MFKVLFFALLLSSDAIASEGPSVQCGDCGSCDCSPLAKQVGFLQYGVLDKLDDVKRACNRHAGGHDDDTSSSSSEHPNQCCPRVQGGSRSVCVRATGIAHHDIKNLQDAVKNADSVYVQGTFNLGDHGTIIIDRSVVIERASTCEVATSIVGGFESFTVESGSHDVVVRNIHFDRSLHTAIRFRSVNTMLIDGASFSNISGFTVESELQGVFINEAVGILGAWGRGDSLATRHTVGELTVTKCHFDMSLRDANGLIVSRNRQANDDDPRDPISYSSRGIQVYAATYLRRSYVARNVFVNSNRIGYDTIANDGRMEFVHNTMRSDTNCSGGVYSPSPVCMHINILSNFALGSPAQNNANSPSVLVAGNSFEIEANDVASAYAILYGGTMKRMQTLNNEFVFKRNAVFALFHTAIEPLWPAALSNGPSLENLYAHNTFSGRLTLKRAPQTPPFNGLLVLTANLVPTGVAIIDGTRFIDNDDEQVIYNTPINVTVGHGPFGARNTVIVGCHRANIIDLVTPDVGRVYVNTCQETNSLVTVSQHETASVDQQSFSFLRIPSPR